MNGAETSDAASAIPPPLGRKVPYADELEGAEMSDATVEELLAGPLRDLGADEKRFPSLRGIIRYDTRVVRFEEGGVVIRQGDYGDSAFVILRGRVHIPLKHIPPERLGQRRSRRSNLFRSLARIFSPSSPFPEARRGFERPDPKSQHGRRLMLQDIPEFLADEADGERGLDPKAVTTLEGGAEKAGDHRGEIFGEIAALSRTPRSASVLAAEGGAVLLEIGWKGLNDIRKYSPGWKRMIDEQYRATSLVAHLRNAEYTRHLSQAPFVPAEEGGEEISEFEHVAEHTKFHSYGEFEWKESFKEMAEGGTGDSEPVIARQGSFADELILIRAGFARLTRRYNHGEKTVAYLGKGQAFGFAEIYHNGKRSEGEDGPDGEGEPMHYQYTLRAVGYVDTLAIPAPLVEDFIVPKLSSDEKREIGAELTRLKSGDDAPLFDLGGDAGGKLLEFFVEQRAINGNAAMFIDLERCTRCDDCVRACADTHGGDPRFIRHGPEAAGIQLTHACMHCVDPVCMIGCPTGAIHRDPVGDQVVVNEYSCIGCSMCANNCPYDNIQMVELRDEEGEFLAKGEQDETVAASGPSGGKAHAGGSGEPGPGTADANTDVGDRADPLPGQVLGWERRATKCDLCVDQMTGPACFQACPHDALIRADMAHPAPLIKWLERR